MHIHIFFPFSHQVYLQSFSSFFVNVGFILLITFSCYDQTMHTHHKCVCVCAQSKCISFFPSYFNVVDLVLERSNQQDLEKSIQYQIVMN